MKLQAHQVLCRMCTLYPSAVLGSVDSLIDPIEKAVARKINKEGIVGPEVSNVMLCYDMLCYVMLYYVMLYYVMYVMLCYDMLCYVMLCYVMLCYVMLCYVIL